MYYSYPQETLQEVPGEISLALSISGCTMSCKGCHSTETHTKDFGVELTLNEMQRLIDKHKYISCVLFYGGEWEITELIKRINIAKKANLKIALYTGFELSFFNNDFLSLLNYIKVGAYKYKLGGLENKNTNQKFYILKEGNISEDITKTFLKTKVKAKTI